MTKLTNYQNDILEIVSLGHGKMTLHTIAVLSGQGIKPDERPLPTLRYLAELGLVDESLPGKTNSKWKVTELGKQILALRDDAMRQANSEDTTE